MLLSAAPEPAFRNSPLQGSNGATSRTSTSGSSSSRPSTIHPSCSSTRRAGMAMCMITSPSHAITETFSRAPSTTAPGLHWRPEERLKSL
uniref:Uncharacterized protein n=1 Tax=Arundo donax TaxID=35708 RepID=A0A0A9EMB0_ARUDO